MGKLFNKSSAKQIVYVYICTIIITDITLLPHIIYFKNHRCVKMGQSTLLDEHHNIVILRVYRLFFYCFQFFSIVVSEPMYFLQNDIIRIVAVEHIILYKLQTAVLQ